MSWSDENENAALNKKYYNMINYMSRFDRRLKGTGTSARGPRPGNASCSLPEPSTSTKSMLGGSSFHGNTIVRNSATYGTPIQQQRSTMHLQRMQNKHNQTKINGIEMLQNHDKSISKLDQLLTELNNKISKLNNILNSKVDNLDKKLNILNNKLQQKVNQLNKTPDNILQEVVQKCKSLEEINIKLSSRVEMLEKINVINLKQFEKQAETISGLFTKISKEHSDQTATMKKYINELEKNLKDPRRFMKTLKNLNKNNSMKLKIIEH
tara:strand:+ start:406 stop:1206 length:801 start_codon:yes stop_codon:yes gene_type:complete